jgi:O-antigen/teichoic acid export membrane protein
MVALMVLLLGVVAFAAAPAVSLLLGNAYLSSVGVLRVYALAVLINAANQPLLALLQAEGYEHYAGRVVAGAVIVGLFAIAAGARVGGPTGAAFGAVLLQLLQLLLFVPKALQKLRPVLPSRVVTDVTDAGLQVQWLPAEAGDNSADP